MKTTKLITRSALAIAAIVALAGSPARASTTTQIDVTLPKVVPAVSVGLDTDGDGISDHRVSVPGIQDLHLRLNYDNGVAVLAAPRPGAVPRSECAPGALLNERIAIVATTGTNIQLSLTYMSADSSGRRSGPYSVLVPSASVSVPDLGHPMSVNLCAG